MNLLSGQSGRAGRAPDRPRAALTLAETLIAMGILAIGLLGVAAVFPVGGFYVESGDIADRGGAVAQAALSDAVIRGHLDPENWVVHDVNDKEFTGANLGDNASRSFIEFLSGDYRPSPAGGSARRLGLRSAVLQSLNTSLFGVTPPTPEAYRASIFGGAFIIDPVGLAGALAEPHAGQNSPDETIVTDQSTVKSAPARNFPAFAIGEAFSSPAWNNHAISVAGQAVTWPVRRVTLRGVHSTGALNLAGGNARTTPLQRDVATEFFNTTDDLAQFFPDAGDEPVRQRWESFSVASSAPRASIRQARGDYSWLISVAPESTEAVDAMATDPGSFPAEVSAVVFHRRPAARGQEATVEGERLVRARVVTTSPGGGELLLSRRPAGGSFDVTEPVSSPFTDLRPGEFVMVTGPHPLSTARNPQLAVRWCQVLNVQDSGSVTLPDGTEVGLQADDGPNVDRTQPIDQDDVGRVLVALRGPDWPWQPAATNNAALLSNDLRVAILPGAVAVHTKTLRLESGSEWSIE